AARDADDDEFRRDARRQSYLGNDLARFAPLRRIGFGVAFDVKGLFGRDAGQRAVTPEFGQIAVQFPLNPNPQTRLLRLGLRPDHILVNPPPQGQKQSPHVDVAPFGLAAQRAGAPHANAPARKRPQAIDAFGIEFVLNTVVYHNGVALPVFDHP